MTEAALARATDLPGVVFPRGVLGPEAGPVADAVAARAPEAVAGIRAVAAVAWAELQPAIAGAVTRAADVDPDLETLVPLAEDPSPDNALALQLAAHALADLALARARAHERLVALGEGFDEAALSRAAGRSVMDLLDLDAEDYETEVLAYVEADGTPDALATLARATGDEGARALAREAISTLVAPAPVAAGIAELLIGEDMPEDPAADALWMATAREIADCAIEIALAARGDGE